MSEAASFQKSFISLIFRCLLNRLLDLLTNLLNLLANLLNVIKRENWISFPAISVIAVFTAPKETEPGGKGRNNWPIPDSKVQSNFWNIYNKSVGVEWGGRGGLSYKIIPSKTIF